MSRYAEMEALERAQKQLVDAAPNTGWFGWSFRLFFFPNTVRKSLCLRAYIHNIPGAALVALKRKAVSEESSQPPAKIVKGSNSDSARSDLKNSEELDI